MEEEPLTGRHEGNSGEEQAPSIKQQQHGMAGMAWGTGELLLLCTLMPSCCFLPSLLYHLHAYLNIRKTGGQVGMEAGGRGRANRAGRKEKGGCILSAADSDSICSVTSFLLIISFSTIYKCPFLSEWPTLYICICGGGRSRQARRRKGISNSFPLSPSPSSHACLFLLFTHSHLTSYKYK